MREKTYYAEQPDDVEIKTGNTGESIILFRQNIAPVTGEDGVTEYEADEYTLTVPTTPNLAARVLANQSAWLDRAVCADYNAAADKVRATRDRLLSESDWTQIPDGALTPAQKTACSEYRQALRDVPEQPGFPYDVVFPDVSL